MYVLVWLYTNFCVFAKVRIQQINLPKKAKSKTKKRVFERKWNNCDCKNFNKILRNYELKHIEQDLWLNGICDVADIRMMYATNTLQEYIQRLKLWESEIKRFTKLYHKYGPTPEDELIEMLIDKPTD